MTLLMLPLTRGIPLHNDNLKNNEEMEKIFYNYQNEISSLKQEITALEERVTKLENKSSNLARESNLGENKDGGFTESHVINKRCK